MNTGQHGSELADFSTFVGTPEEICSQLAIYRGGKVVAVRLNNATQFELDAMSLVLQRLAQTVPDLLALHEQQVLDSLVEALVPKSVPTPIQLREAGMLARARSSVLEAGDWMTARQIAQLAGFSLGNPSAQPAKWKRAGQIFSITHMGVDYFPAYGLHDHARPRKPLSPILDVLRPKKDGWGMAFWFNSLNSFLGGKYPKDILATDPARVLEAARHEIEPVQHG